MALYERAIAVARSSGDSWALGVALADYALMRSLRSNTERAIALLEEALKVLRPTGDRYMISMTMANRAEFALNDGDLDYAQSLTDEARALAREIEFRPLIAGTLELAAGRPSGTNRSAPRRCGAPRKASTSTSVSPSRHSPRSCGPAGSRRRGTTRQISSAGTPPGRLALSSATKMRSP